MNDARRNLNPDLGAPDSLSEGTNDLEGLRRSASPGRAGRGQRVWGAFGPLRAPLLHGGGTLCRLTTMGEPDYPVRLSLQTLKVLEAFLEDPTAELAGADVRKRGHLSSGTLYPILLRLESAGWLVSRWEKVDPATVGRPRRRLYRVTPTGLRRTSEAFGSLSMNRGVFA